MSSEKYYFGLTQNLASRSRSHNALGKKGFITRYRAWFVIWVEFHVTKTEAMSREKFLKSGQGREWMKSNISDTSSSGSYRKD